MSPLAAPFAVPVGTRPSAILLAARSLLADPARWTRDHAAVDASGEKVDPWEPQACAWCIVGALIAVTPHERPVARMDAYHLFCKFIGDWGSRWNDRASHEEVLSGLLGAAGVAAAREQLEPSPGAPA